MSGWFHGSHSRLLELRDTACSNQANAPLPSRALDRAGESIVIATLSSCHIRWETVNEQARASGDLMMLQLCIGT